MKTLGLTGGVGMGKSTTAQLLRQRDVAIIDTDDVARSLVQPGEPALTEIRRAFGSDIVGPEGLLRRGQLARVVFADDAARRRLEGILHPPIARLWRAQVQSWRNEGVSLAVVAIPLLFETQSETEFDAVICVACAPQTQRERLLARGWSAEQIRQRLAAQWPIGEKIARSDFVIWTEAGLDVHAGQLDRILNRMAASPSRAERALDRNESPSLPGSQPAP